MLGERAQPLVFGSGSQRPVDFLVVRRIKLNLVQAVFFVEGNLAFEFQLGLVDFLQQLFEGLLLFKLGFFVEPAFRKHFDEPGIAQAAPEFCRDGVVLLHVEQERS